MKHIKDKFFTLFPFLNNAYARDKWVVQKLQALPKGSKLLDAGAGECKYKNYCEHLAYTSQDFNGYDGKGDSIGLHTGTWDHTKIDIVSDIVSIPVDNSSFDAVLCTEVLEHVPYPDRAVSELCRILKPNGTIIITAPFCSQTHFAPFHFCTGFNRYWYEKVFSDLNMEITEITRLGNFFDYVLQEILRIPNIAKKYTPLGNASYFIYPLVLLFSLFILPLRFINTKSEEQLCFSYFIVGKKNELNQY